MSMFRSVRLRVSAFALLAFVSACSSTSSDGTNVAEVARDPACVARASSLGEAAARVPRDPSYDAVVVTRTYDCGATFRSAGPAQLTEDRLFRIGSMTKSYVAVATLLLVDEGKLALDEPLGTYLPTAAPAILGVTLRELLNHTSGIFNYTNTDAFWEAFQKDPLRPWSTEEILALALAQPPTPRGEWSYSNTNYILLGMILEAVEKTPLVGILRSRILSPNALDHTFFESGEPLVPAEALSPGFDAEGVDVSRTYGPQWAGAAGAMVATASDAARFVELLGTGALLSPAMQAELVRGVDTPQPGLRYGLGVFLLGAESTAGAGPAIGHGGDIMGSHSWGVYFPERRATVFGVVDSDRGSGNDVLVEVLTGGLLPPAPGAPALTPNNGTPTRSAPRKPLAEL